MLEKQKTIFDNLQLLRMMMSQEAELFREKKKRFYDSEVDFRRACRNHIDRTFKEDSERIMKKQGKIWGFKK